MCIFAVTSVDIIANVIGFEPSTNEDNVTALILMLTTSSGGSLAAEVVVEVNAIDRTAGTVIIDCYDMSSMCVLLFYS